MALKLIPPGKRKGSASYVAKGWVNGREIERSLKTADPAEAETRFLELLVELRRGPKMDKGFTFRDAIDLYAEKRELSKQARVYLARLRDSELGPQQAVSISSNDLQRVALKLYPRAKPETVNRSALTPAASALHHAHYLGKIPVWIRVRKFPETRPPPRAVTPQVERILLTNTTGRQHLLLLLLFRHGWRITEALTLRWQDIDLQRRTVLVHRHKTNEWQVLPLNEEVVAKLHAIPLIEHVGRVFHWGDRHNVYRWLKPLCKKLRVQFTPHMARHTFATEAISDGVPMAHVMAVGGWNDTKAFQRYGRVKWEAMDAAINRGKKGEKPRGEGH